MEIYPLFAGRDALCVCTVEDIEAADEVFDPLYNYSSCCALSDFQCRVSSQAEYLLRERRDKHGNLVVFYSVGMYAGRHAVRADRCQCRDVDRHASRADINDGDRYFDAIDLLAGANTVICDAGWSLQFGAVFGGISAIVINTPGTPASIATTFDGYSLTQKGQGALALGINTIYS